MALFIAAQALTGCELLREVLCYNVFMAGGYLYYRRSRVAARILAAFAALSVIAAFVLSGGHFVPMQGHKFPPDWLYATYGILAVCLISLPLGRIRIPACALLRLWNRRGYTIYLYQSIVFLLVPLISRNTVVHIHGSMLWLVDTALAIALSTLLVQVTHPLERYVLGKITQLAARK